MHLAPDRTPNPLPYSLKRIQSAQMDDILYFRDFTNAPSPIYTLETVLDYSSQTTSSTGDPSFQATWVDPHAICQNVEIIFPGERGLIFLEGAIFRIFREKLNTALIRTQKSTLIELPLTIEGVIVPREFNDNNGILCKKFEIYPAQWSYNAHGAIDAITEGILPEDCVRAGI